jgi:DNA-binding NarL/FixJ family response regulator
MERQVSALIIASPRQLRDSLRVLLAAVPGIDHVSQIDDVPSALAMKVNHNPALVLLDSDLSNDELLAALRRIKNKWPQAQCIVLVDEEQNHNAATAAGADVMMLKGVLASKFYATVEALLSRPETKSGFSSQKVQRT